MARPAWSTRSALTNWFVEQSFISSANTDHLKQGSPTLLLASYRPTDISSNPNQTHLNQLVKLFKATCLFQTGVLEQAWNWNLQDGSSPGAGLEIPDLKQQ